MVKISSVCLFVCLCVCMWRNELTLVFPETGHNVSSVKKLFVRSSGCRPVPFNPG
jgi:hypothetical protein